MNTVLDTIKDQGIPIHSANAAAQHMGASEQGIGTLSDAEYIKRIKDITKTTVSYADNDMYRMTYKYLVTEAIARGMNTDKLDATELLTIAEEKAKVLKTDNPWMFVKGESEPTLDSNGEVKAKKGSKKILAMQIYADDIKDKVTVRKDAIAILVDKAGMTPAGASTYYANLKKNDGVL